MTFPLLSCGGVFASQFSSLGPVGGVAILPSRGALLGAGWDVHAGLSWGCERKRHWGVPAGPPGAGTAGRGRHPRQWAAPRCRPSAGRARSAGRHQHRVLHPPGAGQRSPPVGAGPRRDRSRAAFGRGCHRAPARAGRPGSCPSAAGAPGGAGRSQRAAAAELLARQSRLRAGPLPGRASSQSADDGAVADVHTRSQHPPRGVPRFRGERALLRRRRPAGECGVRPAGLSRPGRRRPPAHRANRRALTQKP